MVLSNSSIFGRIHSHQGHDSNGDTHYLQGHILITWHSCLSTCVCLILSSNFCRKEKPHPLVGVAGWWRQWHMVLVLSGVHVCIWPTWVWSGSSMRSTCCGHQGVFGDGMKDLLKRSTPLNWQCTMFLRILPIFALGICPNHTLSASICVLWNVVCWHFLCGGVKVPPMLLNGFVIMDSFIFSELKT